MDRRSFLAGVALLASSRLFAFGQQLRQAQVSLNQVIEAYHSQQCPAWCWAASISMVFDFYGHPTDQKRIAATLYGNPPPCRPGDPRGMLSLLNRDWTDDSGDTFTCQSTGLYDYFAGVDNMTPQQVIDSLDGGDPLFLCTTDHAM